MSGNNYSLSYECESLSKLQTKCLSEAVLLKLYEFIFIVCVVVALHLLDIIINSEYKLKKVKLSEMRLRSKRIVHIISLSFLILTLPFIAMLITGALLYKILCSVAIKRKDRRFVQFLDSFDVFYCLEDKNTTDIKGTVQSNTIELALDNIKKKLRNVFTKHSTDKMFYRRNEEYGFYYWRRYSCIDLAQYVQIEETPDILDKGHIENDDKCISNSDEGLFKVIIMKNHSNEVKDEYNITLKFHHSIKDAKLLEFVTCLVEKSDDCQVTLHSIPELRDHDSPDAIMEMITKLYNIIADTFEYNNTRYNQYSINRMKALEWTQSDENLLCKVKDVCDLKIRDVISDALAKVLNKLER